MTFCDKKNLHKTIDLAFKSKNIKLHMKNLNELDKVLKEHIEYMILASLSCMVLNRKKRLVPFYLHTMEYMRIDKKFDLNALQTFNSNKCIRKKFTKNEPEQQVTSN